MFKWLKRKLRPPLPPDEPYLRDPTGRNLYELLKKQCPVCGKKPPDWFEGRDVNDSVCGRCCATYVVDQMTKLAKEKMHVLL
jgi:hypothetical protein